MAPSRLTIRPGRGLQGRFTPPGDKSITHRAYLMGGMAGGTTTVENPNPGADCESTLSCLEALGVSVTRSPGRVELRGCGMAFHRPARVLDCGNSGTTLRLLAGPLAAQPFRSELAGDASLNRRPVDRVIEPLRQMGATLSARDGDRVPPLVIEGGPLRPIHYEVPSSSAQVASCVLLAGLHASGTTTVTVHQGTRDHTERMLPLFGAAVDLHPGEGWHPDRAPRSVTGPVILRGTSVRVPGDFSAAAFFLVGAAATPGATVTAEGVSLNPSRLGALGVLSAMGVEGALAEVGPDGQPAGPHGEEFGLVTVTGPRELRPFELTNRFALQSAIDEIPALAMAAARARGVSRIEGAAELRVKESDRLSALADNLRRLGIRVEEWRDGLAIHGGVVQGGEVDARGDHRIAMALAILGTMATGPVTVRGAGEIATSYPGFIETLRALGADVEISEQGTVPA